VTHMGYFFMELIIMAKTATVRTRIEPLRFVPAGFAG
jgi:hypothetical protein